MDQPPIETPTIIILLFYGSYLLAFGALAFMGGRLLADIRKEKREEQNQ